MSLCTVAMFWVSDLLEGKAATLAGCVSLRLLSADTHTHIHLDYSLKLCSEHGGSGMYSCKSSQDNYRSVCLKQSSLVGSRVRRGITGRGPDHTKHILQSCAH